MLITTDIFYLLFERVRTIMNCGPHSGMDYTIRRTDNHVKLEEL